MGSMIPCYDCFSEDRKIDYGEFAPCQYPCCKCKSKKYKQCKQCKYPSLKTENCDLHLEHSE